MSGFEEHAAWVREHDRPGGLLSRSSKHATVNNEKWFDRDDDDAPETKLERALLHERVLKDWEDRFPNALNGRQAIVLAGPPGAGKSTSQEQLMRAAGLPKERWRVINNDDFKDQLLRAAIDDGSYETDLLPPALAASGEKVWPRELATLVHEEAGILTKEATRRAIRTGTNVVLDGTLSDAAEAHDLLKQLQAAEYDVRVAVVDAPLDVAEARVRHRWRTGYLAAEHGVATDDELAAELGGRSVPSRVVGQTYDRDDTSRCLPIALDVAERHERVCEYRAYRVSEPARDPELQAHRGRLEPKGPLLEDEPYRAMIRSGAMRRHPRRPHVTGPGEDAAATSAAPRPSQAPDHGAER